MSLFRGSSQCLAREGEGSGADFTRGWVAVTLFSLSLIMSLTIYEFIDYRRVHMVSPAPSGAMREGGEERGRKKRDWAEARGARRAGAGAGESYGS